MTVSLKLDCQWHFVGKENAAHFFTKYLIDALGPTLLQLDVS